MARKPSTLRTIINELVDRTNTDTQRIRVLEQREESLSLRIKTLEDEILNINNTLQKLSDELEKGFGKRDKNITEIQSTIKEILRHVKRLATQSKVRELEALINIYNPLKSNFMTKEEVERLISQRLSRMSKNNK